MIYCYEGYVYLHGKQLHSRPVYLEVDAVSLKQAKYKIMYRFKNWMSLPRTSKVEIDNTCIKSIQDSDRRNMGNRKIILAE